MTRPLYQTQQNKNEERKIAEYLSKLWQLQVFQNPIDYRADWVVLESLREEPFPDAPLRTAPQKIKAVLELKIRPGNAHDTHPTYMIAASKIRAGLDWAWFYGLSLNINADPLNMPVRFYLVVKFTDGLFWTSISTAFYENTIHYQPGGRTDRNDSQDIEICGYIPYYYFVPVPKSPRFDW